MTVILGALAVVAVGTGLLARRLEHMGVLVGLVGGLLAVELLGRGAASSAVVLVAGGGIMAAVVLGGVAVIEVDARPTRRLQPWKLLLLVPLVVVGVSAGVGGSVVAVAPGARAVSGVLLVMGLVALGVPLLVRRQSSPPASSGGSP